MPTALNPTRCYYEILNVERNADEADLKKSYRRLALRYHPDKNKDNEEEAQRLFLEVQEAYEILSDSNERAWYDKHREVILYGENDYEDRLGILQYFRRSCYSGYDDNNEESFFNVYSRLFESLVEEEQKYMTEDIAFPVFGNSKHSYEDLCKPFYVFWESFITQRSFVWVEEHNTREAPNRKVAKLMERDNKKLRNAAKREWNETVRRLVSLVKKRDPRVKTFLTAEKLAKQKKLEEQQQRINEERIRRKAELEKFRAEFLSKLESESESDVVSSDEEVVHYFCELCSKSFKTAKSLQNHERSKKHLEIAAELLGSVGDQSVDASDDDVIESLDAKDIPPFTCTVCSKIFQSTKARDNHLKSKKHKTNAMKYSREDELQKSESDAESTPCKQISNQESDNPIDEDAFQRLVENFSSKCTASLHQESMDDFHPQSAPAHVNSQEDNEKPEENRSSKKSRKKKSNKKSVASNHQKNLQSDVPDFVCRVCEKKFQSRNYLFTHLKDSKHAAVTSVSNKIRKK